MVSFYAIKSIKMLQYNDQGSQNLPFYYWLWVCCNLNNPLNISSIPNCFINVLVSIKPYSQIGFLLFQNSDEFTFSLCIIGMVNNCTRICTLVIFGRLMNSDSLKMRCKYYHRWAYGIKFAGCTKSCGRK